MTLVPPISLNMPLIRLPVPTTNSNSVNANNESVPSSSVVQQAPNMTQSTSSATFSPIQDRSPLRVPSPNNRDSPHTFVSTYEEWNNTLYATTSEEENEDEEGSDDGASTDLSNDEKMAHDPCWPSRKLLESDDDDYDDCSTLSSVTHDVDILPTGIPKVGEDITADCPPNPPVRTTTREDATRLEEDVRAKATGRATMGVARKRAPVMRDVKDDEFQYRRRQRMAERKQTSVAATSSTAPSSSAAGTVGTRSMVELENESKKRAAVRPAVMTRRAPADLSSGTSSLAQQVAARNMARANVTAVAATHDRAALKQAAEEQTGPTLASKKADPGIPSDTCHQLADKKPSPLQASLLARNASRVSTTPTPQSVSRAQDRAAAKNTLSDNGPRLAAPHKPPSTQSPASTLQEALRARQAVPIPVAMNHAWDRAARKKAQDNDDDDDDDETSDEEQGPQLAMLMSRKKAPSTASDASTRSFVMPQSVSKAMDRAAAKMAGQEDGPQLAELAPKASSKADPPSDLQAAMQARQASRLSYVPMPTAVSRAMDRAGAKMESADASSDGEDDGPQLAVPKRYQQGLPSELQAAVKAREISRSTAVSMPTSINRDMNRAGAKMADEKEGSKLAISTSRSTRESPSDLQAAMRARTASRSPMSSVPMPTSVSRAMDRAGAKMADEEEQGPRVAALTSHSVKNPSSDLQAAMQARTVSRGTSSVAMPEAVSRAMDRAGAKMGDFCSDEEQGPQLARARDHMLNDSTKDVYPSELDEKMSARRPRAYPDMAQVGSNATHSTLTPGAIASNEEPDVDKKLEKSAGESEDEGPTLAPPMASEGQALRGVSSSTLDEYSAHGYPNDMVLLQIAGQNDFTIVPAVYANDYDIEGAHGPTEDSIDEIQEGLVVTEGQAGAYAVQGIDATGEDDLYHDAFDPTSAAFEDETPIVAESFPRATTIAGPAFEVAPLQAELFDQPLVQGDIYVEDELEADPKFQRQLRIMQMIILCTSLFGIAFVVISVVAGLDSGPVPAPSITGWRSIGNAIYGPNIEESQIFFGASTAISADGARVVVAAPGTDDGDTFNAGEVYIFDETIVDSTNTTWLLTERFRGPGESQIVLSPVSMSSAGDRFAVGYPFHAGGQVQVFEESNGWSQGITLALPWETTTEESWFGYAIDMSDSGAYLAVGAPRDTVSGSASVFRREANGSWSLLGNIITAQESTELFGWSISLVESSTLRVAVGAPSYNTETGLVRVYDWIGDEWVQIGETLQGDDILSRFGETCALSADGTVLAIGVVGSPFEVGQVQIYRQVEGVWVADEQVIRGSESGGAFGTALSITPDGNTLAIGGPANSVFGENSGHIQVWSYDGFAWYLQGSSIGGDANAAYGSSVAVTSDGQRVVGGAPQAAYDSSIPENGYFRVYDRDETVGN